MNSKPNGHVQGSEVAARPSNHDAGEWVSSSETDWEGWHVQSHWFAVRGQVIPAGIEVRCFAEDADGWAPGPGARPFLPTDTPQAITRGLFDQLPLGAILRDHRRKAVAELLQRAAQVAEDFPDGAADWRAQAETAGTPAPRPGRRDAVYRRTAELYKAAVDRGDKAPAEAVRIGLELEAESLGIAAELSPDRELTNKRVRVRKWIKAARDHGGYDLPKAAKRTTSTKGKDQ